MAAHNAGHRNQAHVLAKRGVGQPAKHTRHCGAQTIGIGGTADFAIGGLAASAAFGDAADIAHGFNGRDHRHKAHTDDDGAVKFNAPFKGHGRGKSCGAGHIAEIHLPHQIGHHIACDQADQHGRNRHHAAGEKFQRQRHDDHHQGRHPHGHAAKARLAHQRHAAGGILDTHLDQRQADHQYDQPCHQRRQGKPQAANEGAQEKVENATNHHARHQPGQTGHALARHRRDHHRQKGKRGALHNRQAGANRPHADGLKQRGNAGKQHRHLNHVDHVWKIGAVRAKAKASRARHDDGGGDVADKHRQHMLNAKRYRLGQRWGVIWVAQLFCCAQCCICHFPSSPCWLYALLLGLGAVILPHNVV